MTLDQLRVFVAAAERLHVTQAAAALNMTQSSASAAIQALEASLRTRLFDRVGRRIELTEAGRILLPEARAILARAARAEQALAELAGLERGRLAIWASQTTAGYFLPPLLARFKAAHPAVELALAIGNTAQVARAVADGAADLGFVEGEVEDPLLARVRVGADRLLLVAAAGHPWAGRAAIRPEDLPGLRWVLRERGSGTRQVFEDALRRHGLDPGALEVALELPSNEAVRSAVLWGGHAAVLSELVVAADLATGRLVKIAFDLPERAFRLLFHKERHRSRSVRALEALIVGQAMRQPGSDQ
jgi:DNA-binding transcriptional LysR family regulator